MQLEKALNGIRGKLEGDYQVEGTRWMLERECRKTGAKGGILADEMGLGKTMQIIAVMRGNPMPTLVVTMIGTIGQWKDALFNFGGFKPIIVSASFTGMLPFDEEDEEAAGELVVLTGYSSFQKARGKTPSCLTDTRWGRIILDEGHVIRNQKTKVFKEINALRSETRWILSGTPIQNSAKDLWTLANWIGINDCRDVEELCAKYVLRRTQAEEGARSDKLTLPPLDTQVVYLNFKQPEESNLYNTVAEHFQKTCFDGSRSAMVEGIIRCRQVCAHSLIYQEGCDKKKSNTHEPKRQKVEDKILNSVPSTKMEFLSADIEEFVKKSKEAKIGAKCLVFCTWTLEMKLIQNYLKQKKIASLIFDGSLTRDGKETMLYNFNNSTIPVLILQINCGATGLNLQCASRVYIMSPNWNPCIELQAIGRAYRKGQKNKVNCIRLVMRDTIEERCLNIQKRKTSIIMETMADESIYAKLGALKDDGLDDDDVRELFAPVVVQNQQPSPPPAPPAPPAPLAAPVEDPFVFPDSPSFPPMDNQLPFIEHSDSVLEKFLDEFLADTKDYSPLDDYMPFEPVEANTF